MNTEEAYIEKILKKVKMGEQEPLEEAIAEFTGQMAKRECLCRTTGFLSWN